MKIKLSEIETELKNGHDIAGILFPGEPIYGFVWDGEIDLWQVTIIRNSFGWVYVKTIHPLKDRIEELLKEYGSPSTFVY